MIDALAGEDGVVVGLEFAEVLLAEVAVCEGLAFFFEEGGGDAGAFCSGDADAQPGLWARPGMVEEAGIAVGGGEDEEACVGGGGEEGADGEVEGVGDPAGFVDDEEGDAGEAADAVAIAGEGDDAGAVGEEEGEAIGAVRFEVSLGGEGSDFAEELGGLALGGGDEDDFGLGCEEGVMEGADGGGGGLAPLAATVDEDAAVGGIEDLGLVGVWGEVEGGSGPVGGRGSGGRGGAGAPWDGSQLELIEHDNDFRDWFGSEMVRLR